VGAYEALRKNYLWFILGSVAVLLVAIQVLSVVTEPRREVALQKLDQVIGPLIRDEPVTLEETGTDADGITQASEQRRAQAKVLAQTALSVNQGDSWGILEPLLSCTKCIDELSEEELDELAKFVSVNKPVFEHKKDFSMEEMRTAILDSDLQAEDQWKRISDLRFFRYCYLISEMVLDIRRDNGDDVPKKVVASESVKIAFSSSAPCLAADLLSTAWGIGLSLDDENALLTQLAVNRSRNGLVRDYGLATLGAASLIKKTGAGQFSEQLDFKSNIGMALYGSLAKPLYNVDSEYFALNAPRVLDAMRVPYLEAKIKIEQLHQELEQHLAASYGLSHVLFVMWSGEDNLLRAKSEATMDLTRLAIVLERHRADQGAYPASLEEVAYRFADGMPIDPFSGEGYLYTATGETYRLASIGPSREDAPEDFGEIVWRGCSSK